MTCKAEDLKSLKCRHERIEKHLDGVTEKLGAKLVLKRAIEYGGRKKATFREEDGYTIAFGVNADGGHYVCLRDRENPPIFIAADDVDKDGVE